MIVITHQANTLVYVSVCKGIHSVSWKEPPLRDLIGQITHVLSRLPGYLRVNRSDRNMLIVVFESAVAAQQVESQAQALVGEQLPPPQIQGGT